MNKQKLNKKTETKPECYTVLCTGHILHLTLKKHWFNMISNGSKKEEYREIKPYWVKRLLLDENGNKLTKKTSDDLCEAIKYGLSDNWGDTLISNKAIVNYDKIIFKNGYSTNSPTMIFEYKGLKIGKGYEILGAEKEEFYFKLQLGKILYNSTLSQPCT